MKQIALISSGALFVAVSLFGCGKAPEPLTQQAAKATPESTVEMAGSSLPLETAPAETFPTPTAAPTSALQFSNPETQAAVQSYQNSWQQLQQDTQASQNLSDIDPLTNPQAITDYANKVGTDANQLDQAERAARGLMNPQEKKRFKALQKQLAEPDE